MRMDEADLWLSEASAGSTSLALTLAIASRARVRSWKCSRMSAQGLARDVESKRGEQRGADRGILRAT